jgi:hypothetical protein
MVSRGVSAARPRRTSARIGAGVEPEHPVLQGVPRRQHQHGRLDAAVSHRSEDFETVAAGEREIEQNGVERLGRHTEECALAGTLDDHVVSFALQAFAQGIGHLQLVFDDENSHQSKNSYDRPSKSRRRR